MSDEEYMMSNVIRVAVTYRVCQHWRVPIFRRLACKDNIILKMFYGDDINGTKLVSFTNDPGFDHEKLSTAAIKIKSSGRTSYLLFSPHLFAKLKNFGPDVILAEGGSNFLNNFSVFLYKFIYDVPIVWWTLGELPGRKYSIMGKMYRYLVRVMEKKSDALLGYSSVAMNYFKRNKYDISKCFYSVNCVDTDKVFLEIEKLRPFVNELRKNLDLDGKKVVLFVGALVREKRVEYLLSAFSLIKNKIPLARLLIVGDGEDRSRLELLAKEYHIENKCIFAGSVVKDVTKYFQLADIFVLPGLGGLAVSEALANGLPVICGQGDGCEVDLVLNDVNGYRYSIDISSADCDSYISWLADKMLDLLINDDKLDQFSINAVEIIKNKYNVNTYVSGILKALSYVAK